jgi:beta-lactamase regulating signal transducer with metallopeptidase domain
METVDRYVLTFLLNALWQIPIIASVSALLGWVMRNGPVSHRHAIYATALAACLLLPIASVRTSQPNGRIEVKVAFPPQPAVASPAITPVTALARSGKAARSNVQFPRAFAISVVVIYFVFLAHRLALIVRACVRTRQIRRSVTKHAASPRVERVWSRCLDVFGLHGVTLSSSAHIPSPVTAGLWHKVVLLPDAVFGEESEDVLTTAIGHELAHLARRDSAFLLLYELLYAPVSFHPAAWFIHRRIEQTREMACDELVTSKLMDASVYARSIVNIAATMTCLKNAGYTLGVFDGSILEDRVRRLLERPVANLRRARFLLATGLSALAVCTVIASGLAISARAQSVAHNEMKMAESAFNTGDYATAIQHFQHAVELEPANVNAKLFLANALLSQYYAQTPNPDESLISSALKQYQNALAADPANRRAMEGIVTTDMRLGRTQDARQYATRLTQIDPRSKAALYLGGVVDWMTAYPEFVRARDASGGKPQDYAVADANLRTNLRNQYGPVVDEGIEMLKSAISLDPGYDDAMAYLNLLFRLKAAMADDPADAARYITTADQWVGQALANRKQNGANAKLAAAPLNVDGPPPGPSGVRTPIAAPPPPPPPPPGAGGTINRDGPASTAVPLAPLGGGRYWQVIGTDKSRAAMVLLKDLREKGFAAALVKTSDGVAVIVGPFFDDAAVAKAKGDLEKAGYQPIRMQ